MLRGENGLLNEFRLFCCGWFEDVYLDVVPRLELFEKANIERLQSVRCVGGEGKHNHALLAG